MYAQYAAGEYEEYILVGGDARSGDTVEEHLVEQSNSHPSPRDDRWGLVVHHGIRMEQVHAQRNGEICNV
jgi:hypothetical protein